MKVKAITALRNPIIIRKEHIKWPTRDWDCARRIWLRWYRELFMSWVGIETEEGPCEGLCTTAFVVLGSVTWLMLSKMQGRAAEESLWLMFALFCVKWHWPDGWSFGVFTFLNWSMFVCMIVCLYQPNWRPSAEVSIRLDAQASTQRKHICTGKRSHSYSLWSTPIRLCRLKDSQCTFC